MSHVKLIASTGLVALCVCVRPDLVLAQGTGTKPPQTPRNVPAADQLVVRVYNVADLVLPTPHYPFQTTRIPTVTLGRGASPLNFGGAGGGGGLGGGGGGFGAVAPAGPWLQSVGDHASESEARDADAGVRSRTAALAQVSPKRARQPSSPPAAEQATSEPRVSSRFDIETLQDVLMAAIEPESWTGVGGRGTCTPLGSMLVVRQTQPTHDKISEFLTEVRRSGGTLRPLTVRAHWIRLDAKGLRDLLAERKKAGNSTVADRDKLDQMEAEGMACFAQITCFDGQTVHIVSGRGRTVIDSVNPIVSQGAAAFDPSLSIIHIGAVLQVTPTASADDKEAVLDLHSVVTEWDDNQDLIEVQALVASSDPTGKAASQTLARVDRLNLVAQQLSTTVRVPMNQPVLIGGMTLEPNQGTPKTQLYLVVEVSTPERP